MSESWVLVGMMGAGKSSLGRRLSLLTDRDFLDTDQLLQNRLGRSISQIFSIYGEETFRDHETSVLSGIQPGFNIVSTGGGVVLRDQNWTLMKSLGKVIYLRVSAQTLIARLEVSRKKRPLLDTEDWEDRVIKLLEMRTPLYEKADILIDLDQYQIEEAAEAIIQRLQ